MIQTGGSPARIEVPEKTWSEWVRFKFKFSMLQSVTGIARFYVRHAPHYFWRQVCRGYVWFRKRWPSAPWAIAAIRSGERTA
jgi:hypothetical protein